jgi:hypothetical protein
VSLLDHVWTLHKQSLIWLLLASSLHNLSKDKPSPKSYFCIKKSCYTSCQQNEGVEKKCHHASLCWNIIVIYIFLFYQLMFDDSRELFFFLKDDSRELLSPVLSFNVFSSVPSESLLNMYTKKENQR